MIDWLVGVGLAVSIAAAPPHRPPTGGGGAELAAHGGCLSDEAREEIRALLASNLAELEREGLLPKPDKAPVQLDWPIRAVAGAVAPGIDAISGFVDHDSANPGALLDYQCGQRTYDLAGYNHAGTDIFAWPFSWYRMDRDEVLVVAAAPGVISAKQDGRDDRSCDGRTGDARWNAVYVRQADGSIAWYGHLKRNSLTRKAVGETVEVGEVLGVMGSSGRSAGPHLHLEWYDSSERLVDPFLGPCHRLAKEPTWRAQRAYYASAINRLATHFAPPQFLPCPQTEVPNFADHFEPGDRVYFAAYYRDQRAGQEARYRVLRPDGSEFTSWRHASSAAHYAASYWYWSFDLPPAAPAGEWRFLADFEGRLSEHRFAVGQAATGCDPATALCLHRGRFRVEVDWTSQYDGRSGRGQPATLSDFAGTFAFGDLANVELIVKVLDFGTSIQVYYGQLTDLRFTLRVTDLASGRSKSYGNTPGNCGGLDTAFAAAQGAPEEAAAAGDCLPGPELLCLLEGRYAARLTWHNQFNGRRGNGQAQPLSDLTGLFSYEDPSNVELLVKALDFGDKILVLYGAISNLEYTLTLTETATGRSRVYVNPPGRFCGGLDPQAF